MAREWRDSGGGSGLPTVDLGHVLRVPRWRLEQMLSAGLGEPDLAAERSVRPIHDSAESTAGGSDGGRPDPETDRQERPMGRKQDRTKAASKQQAGKPTLHDRGTGVRSASSTCSTELPAPPPRPDAMPSTFLDERPKSRSIHWHPAVRSTSAAVPSAAERGRAC